MTDSLPTRVSKAEAEREQSGLPDRIEKRLDEQREALRRMDQAIHDVMHQCGFECDRLKKAVRVLAQHESFGDVGQELAASLLDTPPDPTREATLREVLAELDSIDRFDHGSSNPYAKGNSDGILECLYRVKKLLTAPAPQPPEPVDNDRLQKVLWVLGDFRDHVIKHAVQWRDGGGTHHEIIWARVADALEEPFAGAPQATQPQPPEPTPTRTEAYRAGLEKAAEAVSGLRLPTNSRPDDNYFLGFKNARAWSISAINEALFNAPEPRPQPADGLVEAATAVVTEYADGLIDPCTDEAIGALERLVTAVGAYERERAKEGGEHG